MAMADHLLTAKDSLIVLTHSRPTRRQHRALRLGATSLAGGLALSLAVSSLASAASTPGGSLSRNLTKTPAASLTALGSELGAAVLRPRLLPVRTLEQGRGRQLFTRRQCWAGVTAIEQNTVAFGQSEIPMTAAQQALAKGPVLQIPVDLGGVAISYHIHGISSGLKLNGPTLAKIYLRQITTCGTTRRLPVSTPSSTCPTRTSCPCSARTLRVRATTSTST